MDRRYIAPIAFVAVLFAGVLAAEILSAGSGRDAGRRAPALPHEVLVAPRATLATLRGKPAVINFWASWCPPCRREAPQLARLPSKLGSRARLVGVDWNDSVSGARAFIRHYGWRFSNLRDGDGVVGNRYGLSGLPVTFILDSGGHIGAALRGPQTTGSVERALNAVER